MSLRRLSSLPDDLPLLGEKVEPYKPPKDAFWEKQIPGKPNLIVNSRGQMSYRPPTPPNPKKVLRDDPYYQNILKQGIIPEQAIIPKNVTPREKAFLERHNQLIEEEYCRRLKEDWLRGSWVGDYKPYPGPQETLMREPTAFDRAIFDELQAPVIDCKTRHGMDVSPDFIGSDGYSHRFVVTMKSGRDIAFTAGCCRANWNLLLKNPGVSHWRYIADHEFK